LKGREFPCPRPDGGVETPHRFDGFGPLGSGTALAADLTHPTWRFPNADGY
jgi:hypothetical protein